MTSFSCKRLSGEASAVSAWVLGIAATWQALRILQFCTLRKSQTRDLLRSRETAKTAKQGETMKHLQAGHRSASAGMDWPLSASRPGLFASAITSCQVRELPQTKSTAEVQG